MILRRFTKHVKDQNWFAVALDFFIVVVGILIAFQITNWSEERSEHAQHEVYIGRLHDDFVGIRARLDLHLRHYQMAIEGGDYILSLLKTDNTDSIEETINHDRLEKAVYGLTSVRISPGAAATYLEMLSEGQLSSVQPLTLRDKLAEYNRLLDIVREVDRLVSDRSIRQRALSLWVPPCKARKTLQALVLRRDELVKMRTAEQNRLQAPDNQPVRASLRAMLKALCAQIVALEEQIKALIETSKTLRQSHATLVAVPGIGALTAASLLALMPELGTLGRRQVAALAGLAPHPKDSGNHNGYRNVRGGRSQVKRTLFMAALVASKHHPVLKLVYKKLIENGKKPIVAITAIMRRLIVIINAKIRDMYKNIQVS